MFQQSRDMEVNSGVKHSIKITVSSENAFRKLCSSSKRNLHLINRETRET